MTSTRKLILELEKIQRDPDLWLVFTSAESGLEGTTAFLRMVDLFREVLNEVNFSSLSEQSKKKHCKRVQDFFNHFINGCRLAPDPLSEDLGFGKEKILGANFDFDRIVEYFELLSDNFELSGVVKRETDDIASVAMIRSTTSKLIDEVSNSNLQELMKKSLIIKLSGIRRMCEMSAVYSEKDVRGQVKFIMADLFSEWESVRSQDESLLKKMREWGGGALKGSSRMLGITADVSEVAALLSPPSN